MKKQDIIENISESTKVNKIDVRIVVEAFLSEIKNANAKGESVYIRGFGTFGIQQRAPIVARVVQTGEPFPVAARVVPKFKPAEEYKEMVKRVPVKEIKEKA